MKQVSCTLATLALLLVLVGLPTQLRAQTFEGVVEYTITTEEGTMPMTYMSKGDNVRVEMEGRPGMKAVILMDTKANKSTMLMEQMKMYMEMPSPPTSEEETTKPEITKTGKSQKILGYDCQEYVVKEGDEVTDVWVTKDLGKFQMFRMGGPGAKKEADEWQKIIGSENGFPLLATTKNGDDQVSKMVATKVDKKSLDDALFQIPEGFKAMDPSMMRRPRQ